MNLEFRGGEYIKSKDIGRGNRRYVDREKIVVVESCYFFIRKYFWIIGYG